MKRSSSLPSPEANLEGISTFLGFASFDQIKEEDLILTQEKLDKLNVVSMNEIIEEENPSLESSNTLSKDNKIIFNDESDKNSLNLDESPNSKNIATEYSSYNFRNIMHEKPNFLPSFPFETEPSLANNEEFLVMKNEERFHRPLGDITLERDMKWKSTFSPKQSITKEPYLLQEEDKGITEDRFSDILVPIKGFSSKSSIMRRTKRRVHSLEKPNSKDKKLITDRFRVENLNKGLDFHKGKLSQGLRRDNYWREKDRRGDGIQVNECNLLRHKPSIGGGIKQLSSVASTVKYNKISTLGCNIMNPTSPGISQGCFLGGFNRQESNFDIPNAIGRILRSIEKLCYSINNLEKKMEFKDKGVMMRIDSSLKW